MLREHGITPHNLPGRLARSEHHEALPIDDPQVRQPDITRAGDLLGWAPEVELRDGLQRTIAHYAQSLGLAAPN